MTIQRLPSQHSSNYTCQWFAGKKLESGHFEEDSLQSLKPTSK